MSQEEQNELSEASNKVVICADDVQAALQFWTNFNIEIPPSMKEAFDNFAADPTFANQQKVKLEVTKAISTTEHEAFSDEMFSKIRTECAEVAYKMAFDEQLEQALTVNKT